MNTDIIQVGSNGSVQHSGSVAGALVNNDMDVSCLRTNDVLLYDEWKLIDEAVVQVFQERLVGVRDLMSYGLTYNIGNGLASTVLQWQTESDFTPAGISMDGLTKQQQDRPTYETKYLPLPIIHKDFQINTRVLAESRKKGEPLQTSMARLASRVVAEKVEEILFKGASSYSYASGVLYGYEDFNHASTGSLSANWDTSAATGEVILEDTLAMIQKQINMHHYGPFQMYIPQAYETKMEEDFKANSDRTIRERLLAINSLRGITVCDTMSEHTVLLVEMSRESVELVVGMEPTTIQWVEQGGLTNLFKVMTIMVPRFFADQNGNCGIVKYS